MASNNYSNGILNILNQNLDYVNDTIKVLVVSDSYTFDKTDEFVSDISNEVSGTGYSRKTLSNKGITLVSGSPDEFHFTADSISFTNVDVSPDNMAAVVVYKEVTNDSDSLVIAYVDIADISTNGTTINIQFASSGNVVFKAINTIT